ncbi:ABC transporter ATP-binding protein [Candidatus Bathyarchaeota archaeon]|nr:MAG: ABC transporter ATP-binding protein [Candidatus Bathyarchaeota archaeon]
MLRVENLTKIFRTGFLGKGEEIIAVNEVSFLLRKGEILSLIGESGSGKTTVARLILKLLRPTSGHIYYKDTDIWDIPSKTYWRKIQAIFQDPYASFNSFYKVDRILKNVFKLFPDKISEEEKDRKIYEVLERIGLDPKEVLGKHPFELSGGQMQRLLLARCLIIDPEVIIADEPTSMIDASMRVILLNILKELSNKAGKSIIFITHDISQAFYVSDRVLVMYRGRIVESDSVEHILFSPQHPYTKRLISDVPKLHEKFKFTLT